MVACDRTYLEGGHDVALSCVALGLGHSAHAEVTLERVQGHRAADNSCIVSHCHLIIIRMPSNIDIDAYLLEQTWTQ